ncbi:aminotransferase class I/II-fold pyridoxal phosphate-dependent enzyme [Bythopirellula polymerisocia]|uniref:8-amino-7-oxononanoate synthase 2 n=1 Tax=Bythopirellula polymerisocia TaxID=2528003 RepID=A0A5C6CYX4_9BACT|nr:8-amino-7-oxononanoate synthase [Bythopirellula polymerisocia]TWU30133.1 8-amino-7-oxononanoate synthase 2 [Bythopirellula polymerisocia]
MEPLDWIDEELGRRQQAGLLRTLPPPLSTAGALVEVAGKSIINFASNDYLGLAADARLSQAAMDSFSEQGVGRGASPLVSGRSVVHEALEKRLAEFFATESALLFPTSFAANAGIIPALVDEGDAIYGDAKNHASIIDGCRLSRAERHIYPHVDVDALAALLAKGKKYRRRLIVTDTLFSMDGDLAPLPQIAELAHKHDAMLMVDEAHAVGVFGANGRGVVEHFSETHPELLARVHVRVGSFGKALGAAGGFVCGSAALVQWLANVARTYVFSTAHPAAVSAAALLALDLVDREPARRQGLLYRAAQLRKRLNAAGWDTGRSDSQIIPVILGSAERTMQISTQLRERGIWAPGIRPPSVPAGQSLLRLGFTAGHTEEMVERLIQGLGDIGMESGSVVPDMPK